MTKKDAEKVLRRKYPDAEIYRPSEKCGLCKKGSIAVIFEPGGKVYSYMVVSYGELLERLGLIER
jgi:hypothetical protein